MKYFKTLAILCLLFPNSIFTQNDTTYFEGNISSSTSWEGVMFLTGSVVVEENVTLTIEPGTMVYVKSDRNYKTFDKGGIFIFGGTIHAVGTPDQMIWFTSDDECPINGDWGGIEITNSNNSVFDYCIVEYAELGIAQYFSEVDILHSIVRWNNSEGIYAENSTATFEYNRFYENAYHEIALENENINILVRYNEFSRKNRAIIFQSSDGVFRYNYVHDFEGSPIIDITLGSNVTADNNLFLNNSIDLWNTEPDGIVDTSGTNDYTGGSINPPVLNYPDTIIHNLPYVPGDPEDLYPYVYDVEDETRKVLGRYGQDIGFGWSMCVVDGYIYKHDTECLSRIDTATGVLTQITNSPLIEGPGGLTFDGTYFWAYDRNDEHLISKFEIDADSVHVLSSFPAPESSVNRALGLTTDSTYLYQASTNQPWIYKMDMAGNMIDTIILSSQFADLVVWSGDGFYGTGGEHGWAKWSADGEYLGTAYPVAHGCWAMHFDGEFLWSLNKTCEVWNDKKIFKAEILELIPPSVQGVQDLIFSEEIEIYPNPASETISFSKIESLVKIEITNILGETVYSKTILGANNDINIADFSKGTYLIRIIDANGVSYKGKFIKE